MISYECMPLLLLNEEQQGKLIFSVLESFPNYVLLLLGVTMVTTHVIPVGLLRPEGGRSR